MIWTENISPEEKKGLTDFIVKIQQGDIEKNDSGGFSDIFFLNNFAIKHTSFWDYDELNWGNDLTDLVLQSDSKILQEVKSTFLPKLIGYSKDGDFVISEKMNGISLYDSILHGQHLTDEIESNCIQYLTDVLKSGWMPLDFSFRCIFPYEESGLKVIDYNLYQELDYLKEMGFEDFDLELPAEEIAQLFWNQIRDTEFPLLEADRKYYV